MENERILPGPGTVIYRFDDFELDPARFELRRAGVAQPVEPQVLSLLILLAANPDRLVSKDEIVEKVWNNRIVSEATVAARVKMARKAVGDDGTRQRLVRTVHGKGFRFVGKVAFATAPSRMAIADPPRPAPPANDHDKPSIAVIPFRLAGDPGPNAFVADALADELIADLARLHWLFVIARGSSFRFRGEEVDCREAGRALGVGYCLTGSLAFAGGGVTVSVELVETASGGVIWAEIYTDALERLHDMRREMAASVVTALEVRIPLHEARAARSKHPNELGAWEAYHMGLDHMFRFNRSDNRIASRMFELATQRDPDFSRGYAGQSFTHFQNAFLTYLPDRATEADRARILAEKALQLDPLDPFCQLNMGRSFWLHGDLAESIEWLDRATDISPNYAQGIYSRAWARTLSGHARQGEADARLALRLSPLDPLRYAMIATCGLSQVMQGHYDDAADLAERAARSPGAHKHIAIIAAVATHLAGRQESAAHWVGWARRSDPALTAGDFLASFPFPRSEARDRIEGTLRDLGV